ncbi:MAG: hypothetical protein JSV44_03630, partial [Candidatus Zixiibacteriota bacterium]
SRKLSKTKAIALTLLLPGAGHMYIGEKRRGEVFMGAEAVAWAGAAAFFIYGNWKEDDYRNFAIEHAGIDPGQDDKEFFKMLSFYDNRNEYNGAGRLYEAGRPYWQGPKYYWQWDSETSREKYRSMRNAAESSFRKAVFMIGVAVANRIVAGIDTFRLLKKKVRSQEDDEEEVDDDYLGFLKKIKVSANPFSSNPKLKLSYTYRF